VLLDKVVDTMWQLLHIRTTNTKKPQRGLLPSTCLIVNRWPTEVARKTHKDTDIPLVTVG
jgi:hypothetical protein